MLKKCLVGVLILVLSISMTLSFTPLASAKIKIRYAHWGANPWIEARVKAFNSSQDEVEVVFEPMADYTTKMIIELSAGTAPTVFSTGIWADLGTWMRRGVLKDLTPLIERDKKELDLSDVNPILLKICQVNKRYYAFPWEVCGVYSTWYNELLFKKSGLAIPPDNWTLNDFITYAQKLTKDTNGDGTPDQFGVSGLSDWWNVRTHAIAFKGAFMYNYDGTKFLGDSPKVKEALGIIYDLIHKYKVTPSRAMIQAMAATPGAGIALERGNLGMQIRDACWTYFATIADPKVAQFNVLPPPVDPATGKYSPQDIAMTSLSISGSASKEETEAAWKFIKFFVSEAGTKAAYDAVGWLQRPPIHAKQNKYFLQPKEEKFKGIRLDLFTKLSYLYVCPENFAAVNLAPIQGQVLQPGWDKVFDGKMSVEEFLKTVTPQVNKLIQEGLK